MRRIAVILWLGCLFIWTNSLVLHAQGTIQGKIVDAQTGKPLSRVNVFLSGTKMGTATNEAGIYRLTDIPAGGYQLVVSILGYQRKVVNIVVGHRESVEIDFELKPVVYQLPKLYVRNFGEEWKEHLERFINYFIGRGGWADSVVILNPKVLVFDENWWGQLTAKAVAPLKIKNKALGYIITYYLKEFSQAGGLTKWDGEPLFREMVPADSAQAAYWKHNRRQAFYGSLRHFLLTLINRRADEAGFVLYNHRKGVYGFLPNNSEEVSADEIIEQGKKDFLYELNFFGRLEIIYLPEDEALAYVKGLPGTYRAPRGAQISYLELNEHPVVVDSDGEIILPYAVTQFGYFAFQRIAYLTPREYRPADF